VQEQAQEAQQKDQAAEQQAAAENGGVLDVPANPEIGNPATQEQGTSSNMQRVEKREERKAERRSAADQAVPGAQGGAQGTVTAVTGQTPAATAMNNGDTANDATPAGAPAHLPFAGVQKDVL
jgi:hypothetical protein